MQEKETDDALIDAFLRLREPFDPKHVGKLPRKTRQGGVIHLDYVGHAAVTQRLLNIDPYWDWEPLAFEESGLPLFVRQAGRPVGLWIKLTILGLTRLGYGSVEGNAFDAEKQLIGDAIRNAAMRFGVALDLWSKEELEVAEAAPVITRGPTKDDVEREKARNLTKELEGQGAEEARAAIEEVLNTDWAEGEKVDRETGEVTKPEFLEGDDELPPLVLGVTLDHYMPWGRLANIPIGGSGKWKNKTWGEMIETEARRTSLKKWVDAGFAEFDKSGTMAVQYQYACIAWNEHLTSRRDATADDLDFSEKVSNDEEDDGSGAQA